MLVLSRRQGESIVLGDNIIITIVEIRGDSVRIAVEFPEGTTIHRREVYERIHRGLSANSGPSRTVE
jgi:carbon storage regulator